MQIPMDRGIVSRMVGRLRRLLAGIRRFRRHGSGQAAPRRGAASAPTKPKESWPGASESDWDRVDEASWESFPASDAPSYTPGKSS